MTMQTENGHQMDNTTDEAEQTAAIALLLEKRARRALGEASEIAMHVRGIAINGKVERGETLPEWSAPMRITAADDLDEMYAQIINWVIYWAETLEMQPPASTIVAWSNAKEVQGFRAGTTPEGAAMLVRLQTMWLLGRHEQIAGHAAGPDYLLDVSRFVFAINARYPSKEPRPKQVSPRPCPLCGEATVGAEWASEDVLDVTVACEHCGHQIDAKPSNILKWLDVDELAEAISTECAQGHHEACVSVACSDICHEHLLVRPPIPEGLCGINGCVYSAGHDQQGAGLGAIQRLHSWKASN
jgi:hypothetical protein